MSVKLGQIRDNDASQITTEHMPENHGITRLKLACLWPTHLRSDTFQSVYFENRILKESNGADF